MVKEQLGKEIYLHLFILFLHIFSSKFIGNVPYSYAITLR